MDILSKKEIYHQVLSGDPSLPKSEIGEMAKEYPYSFPLQCALDRIHKEDPLSITQSNLYAPNIFWLAQSYKEFGDPSAGVEENEISSSEQSGESDRSDEEEKAEWKFESISSGTEDIKQASHALSVETPHSGQEEQVSVYDDQLMPYSFRWWLHKTRLEHAETYRPFASEPQINNPVHKKIDFNKIEENTLDQQIRSSILHYQAPEEKINPKYHIRTDENKNVRKTDQILERFIREEPQIKPPTVEKLNVENKARKGSEEQFHMVTETLANIYVEQGHTNKAIEIFRKLILKYPEKKAYFASRISELEKT